ncbi:hypothetical protein HDU96_010607 [Phlyctochytrium bullatum]|nr:hypothetical protein HDU96_010607 [Phlyctochytrium bullatum]
MASLSHPYPLTPTSSSDCDDDASSAPSTPSSTDATLLPPSPPLSPPLSPHVTPATSSGSVKDEVAFEKAAEAGRLASSEVQPPICRICLSDDDADNLFAPCKCKGHSLFVHRYCLNQWRLTLYAHGQLRRGQQMRCSVCQFEYEVEGGWLGTLIQSRVTEVTAVLIFLTTFAVGLAWNLAHPLLHNPLGLPLPQTPPPTSHRVMQMSRLLRDATCAQYGPVTIPCLPNSFRPVIPVMALALAACAVVLDGCILISIGTMSVPKSLRVVFYLLHGVAFWYTSTLLPYELFDLIQNYLLESLHRAEVALVGVFVLFKSVLVDGAYLSFRMAGAGAPPPPATPVPGPGGPHTPGADPAATVAALRYEAASAYVAAYAGAGEFEKLIHNSWPMALVRILYVVLVSAWIYIVKYYYTLVLAWSSIRSYSAMEAAFKKRLARVIGSRFREYRGVR